MEVPTPDTPKHCGHTKKTCLTKAVQQRASKQQQAEQQQQQQAAIDSGDDDDAKGGKVRVKQKATARSSSVRQKGRDARRPSREAAARSSSVRCVREKVRR